MNEWTDNRTWRERLHDLASPVDYGEDTLPAVAQELVDKAYAFMEEAERRGVDGKIDPSWFDNAVDLIVSDGLYGSNWLSVVVGYEDEWKSGESAPHEPVFIRWQGSGRNKPSDRGTVMRSVDEALDWLLSF